MASAVHYGKRLENRDMGTDGRSARNSAAALVRSPAAVAGDDGIGLGYGNHRQKEQGGIEPLALPAKIRDESAPGAMPARRSAGTRAFPEPRGALYDKLHVSHDGYAGAVPIVHKSGAVSEVIAQLAIEADEDPD
jgi:hypothetical protein